MSEGWPEHEALVGVEPSKAFDESMPSSPVPFKRAVMDFPEAVRAVLSGKRITRLQWNDRDAYGFLHGGLLMLHKGGEPDAKYHAWLVSDGDLTGTDWITL